MDPKTDPKRIQSEVGVDLPIDIESIEDLVSPKRELTGLGGHYEDEQGES